MSWWPRRKTPVPPAPVIYHLTFRMQTGLGRLEARSSEELSRLLAEIRIAGGHDITVVDSEGRLVAFDPGGPR